jgi:hypothetical protein
MVNIAVILMHEAYHHILIELIMAFKIDNEEEVYVVIWEGGMTIIDQRGAVGEEKQVEEKPIESESQKN